MSIVTYENVDTPVFEIDFLRYLFTNGAQGSLWGPLPYYSDAVGTVEADWGDPVGNIPDASGNGNGWTQVTSTARPILGRVPVGGRRNRLQFTEEWDSPYWRSNYSSETVRTYGVDDPWGGKRAVRLERVPETSGRFGGEIIDDPFSEGDAIAVSIWLRVVSGSSTSVAFNYTGKSYSFSGLTEEWQEFTLESTAGTSGSLWVLVIPSSSTIEVAFPQTSDEPTPYQRVGNEYDITEAGVNEIHYLRFDGTDDQVTTTLPAISGGTIVLAGTNGIWIDEIDFAGGEFSVGPDTYTGGPAGLMSILGDILVEGGFVIDRALTPKEIAQVEGYYKARGSAGLIELGPELVVNGTFDTDLSGWEASNETTNIVWENGAMRMEVAANSFGSTSSTLSDPVPENALIIASADVIENTGSSIIFRTSGSNVNNPIFFNNFSGTGRIRAIGAPSSGVASRVNIGNSNSASPATSRLLDNIRVRRLIMPGETP